MPGMLLAPFMWFLTKAWNLDFIREQFEKEVLSGQSEVLDRSIAALPPQ